MGMQNMAPMPGVGQPQQLAGGGGSSGGMPQMGMPGAPAHMAQVPMQQQQMMMQMQQQRQIMAGLMAAGRGMPGFPPR